METAKQIDDLNLLLENHGLGCVSGVGMKPLILVPHEKERSFWVKVIVNEYIGDLNQESVWKI